MLQGSIQELFVVGFRGCFWLQAQESLLVMLGGPYGVQGVEPGFHVQAKALLAILSLQSLLKSFQQ